MNIGIFGATGTIGSRILNEALRRGHKVTAFVRDASRIPPHDTKVTWKVADILDADSIANVIAGQDVVISAYGPGRAGDPRHIVDAAAALLKAFEKHPEVRLIVVGGAGSLEVAPGKTVIDSGMIPPEWIAVPIAARDALELFRSNQTVQWTYFSPAAMIQPGERTGKFRLGGDQLIVGPDGKSAISCEDYAVAMLDEAENPQHIRQRFTIGY
jgi:putative NADH-flavin reductase